MVSIEGAQLSAADENLLKRSSVGGLILFSRNYQTKSQVTALIRAVRGINPSLLIAVDQEGGRVRIHMYCSPSVKLKRGCWPLKW